nr:PVR related immunoglobulin domain containing [Myotis myotis]
MGRPRALVLLLALLTLCITAGTPEVWVQVQMEATKPLSLTVRCGFLGSDTISLVTVSCVGADGAGGTKLAVLHPELGTQQWPPAHQAHWETRTSVSLTLGGSEERSLGPNTTFCCKFTSFPEGSQEACGNLLVTEQGGADEGSGRAGRNSGHQPGIWYVSLCAQGSLPLLQPLFCGLTWPGFGESQGSSSLAVSTSSTCCIGRGTGLSRSFSQPSAAPRHRHKQRQPAKPPWPLSTSPTPPSPPTTSARQLWTRSFHPSHCPGGSRSPTTLHSILPLGHLCQPLLATVSSPLRMDSMFRQKRGPPTSVPTSSLSLTLWGPEPWRGV